jgi:hypothetical protein
MALLILHLLWRSARYLAGFPIWGDEAFVAISLDERSYAGLFHPLEYGQIAPLGWMWLEKAMLDVFGPHEWSLRLPAFVAGIVSAVLMFRLCFRLAPGAGGLLGFAIFAASYYPVRHGAEVKPYAFDLLWALLLITAALAFLEARPRARAWIGLALSVWLGVWFSYPSLFVSAAALSLLGWRALRGRRWPELWLLLWVGGVGAASALWMLIAYAAPHAAAASWLTEMAMWTPAFPPAAQPWQWPGWLLQAHAGYMSAYPTGGRDFGSAATLLLIGIGIWWWRPAQRGALLWLLLGALTFNFLAALGEKYPYGGSVRTSIFCAPGFCLLAGCGLAALLARWRAERRGIPVACLALALMPIGGMVEDLAHPYKLDADIACEQFVAQLAAEMQPGDRIVGFTNATADEQPDWFGLGGSGARLRWQLSHRLPVSVEWLAPPPPLTSRAYLLVYADDNDTRMPFPTAEYERVRADWEKARGEPELVRSIPFRKAERVELLRFAAAPR